MRRQDGFAEFERLKRSPKEFHAEAFRREDRLRAMSIFTYGERALHETGQLFTSLSDSNEDFTTVKRLAGKRIGMARMSTSGYVAPPGMHFSDAITINVSLSATASLGSKQIGKGDIYMNLSKVCPMQFGPGEYFRLMFPKGNLTAPNVRNNQLLIFRRDDPVTQFIRGAAESVEAAAIDGNEKNLRILEELMVTGTQQVLEHALSTEPTAGYNHIRDQAIEYIRDNLHRPDLSITEITAYAKVSRATLYRAFENVGGLKHFMNCERIARAKSMLKLGDADRGQISAVAYDTGFVSPEQFSKVFKAHTGITPTQFIEGI